MNQLAVFLVVLLGCSTPTGADRQQPVFLAGSGSFEKAMRGAKEVSLHPRARRVHPKPGQSHWELQQATDRAITDVLRERGFSVVRPGRGDREIAYAIGIEGEMTDVEMVRLFGIAPGVDDRSEDLRGGIVLAVVHRSTGNVLWRGSASGAGDGPEAGTAEFTDRIRNAVRAVMASAPLRLTTTL